MPSDIEYGRKGLWTLPPSTPASAGRRGEWKDILEILWVEIGELHHRRKVLTFTYDSLKQRPHSGIIQHALSRCYVEAQCSCIRRLTSDRADSHSFYRLLRDIERHRSMLKRDAFDLDIAGDSQWLKKIDQTIGKWVSENIAHTGKEKTVPLDLAAFDETIDILGDLLNKYFVAVVGSAPGRLAPRLPATWKDPLR